MSRYLLQKHVFLCFSGVHVVFLDLRRDKYLAVEQSQTSCFDRIVEGWPTVEHRLMKGAAVAEESTGQLAQDMLESGLLTASEAQGKVAKPITTDTPASNLLEEYLEVDPQIRMGHVANFLAASFTGAVKIRWRSLERVIEGLRRRKKRNSSVDQPANLQKARQLVAIFNSLRPLFFTAKGACLFESLALIEFLNRYGLYPTLVLGVRADPFAAHSWVQERDVVLNDDFEWVGHYTPIMAV